MKIKLLKDIPGYKAGEILEYASFRVLLKDDECQINSRQLIETGWAEEIKDDIDIEEIRKEINEYLNRFERYANDTLPDGKWFRAYRIVKAVIEKLNGGMKGSVEIYWSNEDSKFDTWNDVNIKEVILPKCSSEEVAEKVISLCEPELKVLFGVK